MHFTSADDFLFRSNDQLVNQSVSDSKMQPSQSSSMSSTSNHTVSSLINAYNSAEDQQSVPSQISHSSYLNPALIEVMSTLSSLNQLNAENINSSNNNNSHSYPFFEFQKYFQQQQQQQHFLPIQNTDTEKLKKSLNTESLTDMCLSLPISSVASTSSSSNISSPSNTPCKKRALSDVISKLRNQQTNVNEDDKNNSNSGDLEVDNNNETDSAHNNSTNNDYSTSVGDENDFVNEEDDEDDDDDPDADRENNNNNEEEDLNDLENENDLKKNSKKRKLKSKKSAGNTNCSSSSSSSSSSGIDMISNVSSNSNLMIGTNDFNLISAAEQISAIINNVVVNPANNMTSSPSSPLIQQQQQQQQQQQPSKLATSKTNNDQAIAKASINRINSLIMNTNSSVKKAQMDLLKLLERANLTQYMQVFSEQGGDDINQLVDADEKEFKEIVELVGMASKPLHVKRLRKAIDEYKNSNGKLLNDCLRSSDSKTPMNEATNVTCVNKSSNLLPSVNSSSTNGSHQQLSSHNISKFLSNNDQISSLSTTSHQNNQNTSYWPCSSSSSSSSSVSSTSSSSSISSSSVSNCNPLSVQKICSSSNPTLIVDHQQQQQQQQQATNSATFQTPTNPNSVAALYPLYQLFNSKNVSNFIQQHQQQVLSSLVAPSQSLSTTSNSHDNSTVTTAAAAAAAVVVASIQQNQKKKEETTTSVDEVDGMDDDEEDAEDDEDDQDDTDEEYNEDEENDDYDDEANMNIMGEEDSKSEMKQHSLLKKKNIIDSKNSALAHNQLQQQQQIQSTGSNIKIEQNEKMIKKNKVIELYSKGERCVRKLSQLTGVPLTTVYRVIGKLKGINYNIPRGNGAGRKTILDAQDREILVEILNVQPRISRKALGKELEKRTGKSIHNSTLNRELCRLRHHGHNFAAVHAVAGNSFVNTNNNTNDLNNPMSAFLSNTANVDNQNYLKHFNTSRKSLASTSPSLPTVAVPNLNSGANNSANSKQSVKSKTNTLSKSKLKTEQVLDMEYIKQIAAEAKTLCTTLSKSDTEMRPVSNTSFYNSINELCSQSFNPEHRLNRVKLLITSLLKDDKLSSNHEYTMYMHEACTQISLIKPTLLSRKNDLLLYARRVLDQCLIFDSTKCETQPNKRIKLENKDDDEEEESDQNKEQQQQQQQNQLQYQQQQQQTANTFSSFYTALALHLQNQPNLRTNQMQDLFSRLPLGNVLQSQLNSNEEIKQRQKTLLENNEIQIKINQKYQDDLKSKLAVFSTNETNEQMKFLTEQLRKQLNEAVKKQSELLCEKIRLKTDLELTSNAPNHFNFASSTSLNNNEYEDEQLDDVKSTTSFSSSRSSSRSGRDKETSKNQNDIKSSRSMAVSSITQDQESSRNDNEDELAEITNEKNN